VITEGEFEKMKADWRAHLEGEFDIGQSYKPNKADWLDGQWSGLRTADNQDEIRAAARPACRSRCRCANWARSCRKFPTTSRRTAPSSGSWTTGPR
jgi:2-oxoglutarate dehydrogenase complex dehydrogenase (E1) component-like enzyme